MFSLHIDICRKFEASRAQAHAGALVAMTKRSYWSIPQEDAHGEPVCSLGAWLTSIVSRYDSLRLLEPAPFKISRTKRSQYTSGNRQTIRFLAGASWSTFQSAPSHPGVHYQSKTEASSLADRLRLRFGCSLLCGNCAHHLRYGSLAVIRSCIRDVRLHHPRAASARNPVRLPGATVIKNPCRA
jgi:hypothetical protein